MFGWQQISTGFLEQWANQFILEAALGYFMTFVLVMVRLSGLLLVGPFFGDTTVPSQVRILLVFSLALIITPALPELRSRGFERLDENKDGVLTQTEIPHAYTQANPMQSPEEIDHQSISRSDFATRTGVPSTLFDFLWISATELLIGMMLGLGVTIILTGLQLAGETFDQQTGTALSEIFNPSLGTTISPTGQLFYLLGTTAILCMLPFDGHLMMLMSLMKTFEVLPVGMAWIDVSVIEVIRNLMSQSLLIAIQISAPLLAAMALLSVAMGYLGYTVPQVNVLVLGFPIRAVLSMTILTLTLSGASVAITDSFHDVLVTLTDRLVE